MSIIYDALKKVERINNITTKPGFGKPKFKVYLVYILVVFSGFFIASVFFGWLKLSNNSTELNTNLLIKDKPATNDIKSVTPTETDISTLTEPEPKPKPPLVLNGVFFSQDEGYALINNQIVKEGDNIEGAIVKRIALDEVDLEYEGSVINLSTN